MYLIVYGKQQVQVVRVGLRAVNGTKVVRGRARQMVNTRLPQETDAAQHGKDKEAMALFLCVFNITIQHLRGGERESESRRAGAKKLKNK